MSNFRSIVTFAFLVSCSLLCGGAYSMEEDTTSAPAIRFDHVAFNLPDPHSLAAWYAVNLELKVVHEEGSTDTDLVLSDSLGNAVLEVYRRADQPFLDFASMNPLTFHIAFAVKDIVASKKRLEGSGAVEVEKITTTASGDRVAMLRDPWGIPLQLVSRVVPMLKADGEIGIEHAAINVADARSQAAWFNEQLRMKTVREGGPPDYGRFLADWGQTRMLEIYQKGEVPALHWNTISPWSLHLGFSVDNLEGVRVRLLSAGAAVAEDITKTASGDLKLVMRDPHGVTLHFIRRVNQSHNHTRE